MSMSFKASPDGTFGEILVNGQVVAKLPITGNAVIPGLVGTVSQSGGVPTGAVVERGSNANGQYVRFADGMQICWRRATFSGMTWAASGSVSKSNTLTWDFPSAFADVPVSCAQEEALTGETWTGLSNVPDDSSTKKSWAHFRGSSGVSSMVVKLLAIGRWY